MTELELCLVVNAHGEWRVEARSPIPARIPPLFDWSSELQSAAKRYRRLGEDTVQNKRRRAQYRRRREMVE